jgi:RNA polymerase sigma-70 factor (ECF subfamily)
MSVKEKKFEEFFKSHYVKACRFAYAMVGEAEAEDAAQEAFYKLFRKARGISKIDNLQAYFYRILYHVCVDMTNRKGLWKKIRHLFLPSPVLPQREEERDLGNVWFDLSPTQKEIFLLVDYAGIDETTVSRTLKIAPSTLRVQRRRIRQKIRQWEEKR